MDSFNKIMFMHELGNEIESLKNTYPEADSHTLALVRLLLLEKMQKEGRRFWKTMEDENEQS